MFYAVKVGKANNMIYENWEDCKANVSGVSGAIFKKFSTRQAAENFLEGNKSNTRDYKAEDKLIAYIDGSYNNITKETGYGIVFVKNNKLVCKDYGKVLFINNTTNNVLGELMGALKATELAIANGYKELVIAHDYLGVSAWVIGNWASNTKITKEYKDIMTEYSSKIKISFLKIKAHTDEYEGGSKFNHEADRLAKLASNIM